jgi:hypothetical protein
MQDRGWRIVACMVNPGMELRQLKRFVAVGGTGNITAAARQLRLPSQR